MHLFEINTKCVQIYIMILVTVLHIKFCGSAESADAEETENSRKTKNEILNFGLGNIVDCNNKLLPEAELTFQRGYIKQIRLTLKYYELIQETWSQIEETPADDLLEEFNTRIKDLQLKSKQLFAATNSKEKSRSFTTSDVYAFQRLEDVAGDLASELEIKIKESKGKWTEGKERITVATEKSNEAKKNLAYHVLDMAFKCDIDNLKEELDETAWKVRGTEIMTHSDFILERIKELHRSSKQLESLGYFAETVDEDKNNTEIEEELKNLEEIKTKIVEFIKEHMNVMGPSQLLSFMMDADRLVVAAAEVKAEQRKNYNDIAKKQLKELKHISSDMKDYRKVMEERMDKGKDKSRVEDEL